MEETVDKLQNAFKLTELNLDYLEKRVESEFVDSTADDGDKESPAVLMERLADVKKEYADIMKDVDDIKQLQIDAVNEFRNELLTACQNLQKLQLATGITPPPELDYAEELEKLSLNPNSRHDTETLQNHSSTHLNSEQTKPGNCKPSVVRTECEQINKTPHSKRKDVSDFMEVTSEEFNSVSTLVRGRAKLGDVNRTYKILWEHFQQDKTGALLTPTDMDKMSLRVSGATGEAKLKVLRALKLLHISKKGEVNLI